MSLSLSLVPHCRPLSLTPGPSTSYVRSLIYLFCVYFTPIHVSFTPCSLSFVSCLSLPTPRFIVSAFSLIYLLRSSFFASYQHNCLTAFTSYHSYSSPLIFFSSFSLIAHPHFLSHLPFSPRGSSV